MSDILNYKFYLNFKNEDSFGRIEITEPNGFDGAGFLIEQESKRYGRDAYKINEDFSLTFYKGDFDSVDYHTQMPNGTLIYSLTQGFEYILETYKQWGFEANVDFEIELNGIMFVPSNLDFQTSETDEYSYFTMKALQESDKQLISRRSDIVTDIFSTEDLDGNEVEPAVAENILLKAKPINQYSEFGNGFDITNRNLSAEEAAGQDRIYYYYNNCNAPIVGGIDDTLSYLYDVSRSIDSPSLSLADNFRYLRALDDLSNVEINIKDLVFSQNIDTDNGGDGYASNKMLIQWGESIDNLDGEIVVDSSFVTDSDGSYSFSITDETFTIDGIRRSHYLWIYFTSEVRQSSDTPVGNPRIEAFTSISEYTISINAISVSIDTVVKGVRYIDVIKANLNRINGYSVVAPRYDVGGEYYDQFALTGNLIKRRDDVAFPVSFDDLMADLTELNSDYQTTDKLYIGQYQDYYPNNEIGAFVSSPKTQFKRTFNERYAINEYNFEYETYEQDDDEEDTTDAIHTESQWLPSNLQVENSKDISISYIRDAFKIEKTKQDAVKDTTSTSDDDKMFLLDVVPISPSESGGFSASMTHNVNDEGRVQLLKDTDLPSWAVLGFEVGDTFYISSDANNGEYTVYEITDSIITLNPVTPSTQSDEGEYYTAVEYPYTDVYWTNRTNEGLEYFENLLNGNNYANLKYSIKRNINTWKPYLATALLHKPEGTIKNTYFKDNGEATTRFYWESENVKENATLEKDDLGSPILTTGLYETTLIAPFSEMKDLIDKVNTVNEDGSIGGFIRCIDNNGRVIRLFPQSLDYTPSTEVLNLLGEEKYDGEGIDITLGSTIIINEVGYEEEQLSEPFYEFDGDYFKIYDKDKRNVITPTRYDEITVNGNTFESSSELLGYLINN